LQIIQESPTLTLEKKFTLINKKGSIYHLKNSGILFLDFFHKMIKYDNLKIKLKKKIDDKNHLQKNSQNF
jgi:hypothetical protein